MKFSLSILLLVTTQIHPSFSSELRNAVLSVEESFGKLLTDVVTDVRDTIECTMMAIEQSFGSNRFDKSDYFRKCGGISTDAESSKAQPKLDGAQAQKGINKGDESISRSIKLTVSPVNNIVGSHDSNKRLEKVKSALSKETSRLAEIIRILKEELDKISGDLNKRFKKFQFDTMEPSVENVWEGIKALHEIEQENRSSPEANEITRVFDKVLKVLDIEESSEKSENNKIETIMEKLDQNSNEKLFANIKKEVSEWKYNDTNPTADLKSISVIDDTTSLKKNDIQDFPRTFKDVAKKISDEKISAVTRSPTNNEYKNVFNTEDKTTHQPEVLPITTTQKPEVPKTELPDEISDYESFFKFPSSNKNGHLDAVSQANKIIEDSRRSQMILENFFKTNNHNAKNVFDEPYNFNL